MWRISELLDEGTGKGKCIFEYRVRKWSMLTETIEVKCRWKEHFSELLGGEHLEDGMMGGELSREDRGED